MEEGGADEGFFQAGAGVGVAFFCCIVLVLIFRSCRFLGRESRDGDFEVEFAK